MLALPDIRSADTGEYVVDLSGAKVIEQYSNGAKKYLLRDGSQALIWSDGSAEITRADGANILTWPAVGNGNETYRITFPDGSTESHYSGGAVRKKESDGTVVETWPGSGNEEIRRITRTNGEVESFYADGARKTKRKDGSEITFWPDGHIREVKADGSIWETSNTAKPLINPDILELQPYPDRIQPGAQVIFSGKLKPGYSSPWASIMLPNGDVRTIREEQVRKDDGRFYIEVNFDAGPGRYKVEIIAVGKYGNEVAANFPVWAGDAGPSAEQPKLYPLADPRTPSDVLEKRFWDMVNNTRKEKGIRELPWDNQVSQLARNHARDMADNGFFGHISPKHGNLARRAVDLFGWQTTIWGIPPGPPRAGEPNYIAENLSLTISLASALEGLMESPAHRKTLLFPHFTSGGIGMAWGDSGGQKMLYIVTAFLQQNRPMARVKRKTITHTPQQPTGYHILGRDNE